MVGLRQGPVLLALVTTGCSLVNASTSHTRGSDAGSADAAPTDDAPTDAGPADGGPADAGPTDTGATDTGPTDAPIPSEPTLRVAHLARDTGSIDVYADGRLLTAGLDFSSVGEPAELPAGADVAFRVTRAGTDETLVERTFSATAGRSYTLTLYGDEESPPFPERTLALLLLDDDASGLDVTRDIRLAVIHVASPVIAGQLVAVTPSGNVLLADDFGFAAIAPLSLPSMAYTVGFDAGADGVIDVEFEVPALVPGTYANVFVAARPDDSVYLLVNTDAGATLEIDATDRSPPTVRVAHLARDTGPVDVYADGRLLARAIDFADVGMPSPSSAGSVAFRVTRAGTDEALLTQTLTMEPGRGYTLTVYGDEDSPPFPERTLALLLLNDDASGLDTRREIRLAVVHVASPVIAGQLVSVTPTGNDLLASEFGFRAVAPLSLPSRAYTVGFDAGADGVIDLEFAVPALVPGTYANVFVAARPDDSVFLLVNTSRGATVEIDPS